MGHKNTFCFQFQQPGSQVYHDNQKPMQLRLHQLDKTGMIFFLTLKYLNMSCMMQDLKAFCSLYLPVSDPRRREPPL